MRQSQRTLSIKTNGRGLYEFTEQALGWLERENYKTGLLTLFCQHTSASLIVQENADPDVRRDLADFFARLAPEDFAYAHDSEGPDDMPAHIRAALTQTSLVIPIADGRLALGAWQGVYLFEHRRAPHERRVALHAIGS